MTPALERRLFAAVGAAVFVLSLGVPAAWDSYLRHLGPLDLSASRVGSTIVVDRDGRLLRAFTLADGRWRLPVTTTEVDPRYLAMLIGYEDGRFYDHDGVDFRAMARAAWQWATRGHVVSGGSTLTMQVARLIEPRDERNLPPRPNDVVRRARPPGMDGAIPARRGTWNQRSPGQAANASGARSLPREPGAGRREARELPRAARVGIGSVAALAGENRQARALP